MKPKWQRARKVKSERVLWVRVQPPVIEATTSLVTGKFRPPHHVFITHRIGPNGILVRTSPYTVELLPEFADDVPLIPYKEWLAQGEKCEANQ